MSVLTPTPVEESPLEEAVRRHRTRSLVLLGTAVAGVGFAMTLQMGLNANFVGEEMKLNGFQAGILEASRESCGVFALLILAALAGLAEPVIGAIMLGLLGVGLMSYAYVPSFIWLILASMVWSQGLHVWMPLPNSMAMALAEKGQGGRRLGQIAAAGACGSASGLALAYVLNRFGVHIRPLWIVAGAAALLAAAACIAIPRQIKTPGPRIVVRRSYSHYYLLCFLDGWRKQIFMAFAGYLLVTQYNTPLSTMLLLWMATQVINWFAAPAVGRLIDRAGERTVLMAYFTVVACVFTGYAFIRVREVLFALFILDNVFFIFVMGLTTYVGRIAPPAEHTPTLSLGVAINHVAAVTMPLVGGLLWKHAGYTWTFLIGVLAALASILVASRIPRANRE